MVGNRIVASTSTNWSRPVFIAVLSDALISQTGPPNNECTVTRMFEPQLEIRERPGNSSLFRSRHQTTDK
jgi:hypothetical protein